MLTSMAESCYNCSEDQKIPLYLLQSGEDPVGNRFQQRCMICGRRFDLEALAEITPEENLFAPSPPKIGICPRCEVKINKEAEDAQKEPKPI